MASGYLSLVAPPLITHDYSSGRHSRLGAPMLKSTSSTDDPVLFTVYPIHIWASRKRLFGLTGQGSRLKIGKLELLWECLMVDHVVLTFIKCCCVIRFFFVTNNAYCNSIKELYSILFLDQLDKTEKKTLSYASKYALSRLS